MLTLSFNCGTILTSILSSETVYTMKNTEKNFGFTRKSGILMPLSSLPSKYGIGSLGRNAYDFIDFLYECGQACWQVLPLNPTSYGDSPYQSPASIAGNPYFIDLDILKKKKLLTKEEADSSKDSSPRVNYGKLFNTRYPLLRKAYSRFKEDTKYLNFCEENAFWLDDYALFMSLKVHYNYAPWITWEKEHKNVFSARSNSVKFKDECGFWKWVQFEFMAEWHALLDHAHEKGIVIIGDMPIYVAHDSMDVWCAPEQFLLDGEFVPTLVAGVPPDGFSPDGQLWGNPIYNWELMESQDFAWWTKRVKQNFALYDIIRIDHFRGFAGYYSVKNGEPTARDGWWNPAPGKALFKKIRECFPDAKIIAEDLGVITEDVRELLDATGFPGMKMLHFAFYDKDSEYLPRMYANDNCIAYASSHDSDCTKTWYSRLSGEALLRFKRECPRRKGQTPVEAVIEYAMTSPANLAMACMQDYLELTNEEGRMNTPATAEGNWSWRIKKNYNTPKLREKIRFITSVGGRLNRH